MDSKNWIEKKINNTFKLYTGIRTEDEDKKISDKVLDLVAKEIIKFADENLTGEQKYAIGKLIDLKVESDEIAAHLRTIPNYGFRLKKRMNYFIDSLLVNTINKNNV
jgi:hypothetical protein